MQHGLVADGDVLAHDQGTTRIHVQHARFLHIAAAADGDGLVVAADRHVRPDADEFAQYDLADDVGTVRDISAGVDVGDEVFQLVEGHAIYLEMSGCCGSCSSGSQVALMMSWARPACHR